MRVGLSDAQTSGGLLVCIAPEHLDRFLRELQAAELLAAVIGEVQPGSGIVVA